MAQYWILALFATAACSAGVTLAASGVRQEPDDADEAGEQAVALNALPEPVRAAALPLFGGWDGVAAERERDDDHPRYTLERGGAHGLEASFSADGQVLSVEHTMAGDGLPPAARAALRARFGDLDVVETTAVEVHYFEVLLRRGGGYEEVALLASGGWLDDAEEDEEEDEEDEDGDEEEDDD